ncbi:leucine-rich repeat domain-containing protein [Leptolyngbyaceae cyanobacterium UHCC 1019]
MTNQNDLSKLKTFADWCRAIDRLPAEAKRTVEALKDTIELGYLLNWEQGEPVESYNAVVIECVSSACTKLDLSDYYKSFTLSDVWDLLPDEVRTDLEAEITERIILASTKLSLRDCGGYSYQITDLRPLVCFTHLTSLDIKGNAKDWADRSKLSDISVLSTLTNLTELDLSGNSIIDLSPLAALTQLTKLDLSGSTYIGGIPNIGGNSIIDLSPLAALTELRELNLSRSFVTDLSSLKALKNSTQLELSGDRDHQLTEVIDLSPLLALTQLKSLDLSSNKLTDRALETIAQLTSLERLYIDDNQITDISPLVSLPNLTNLKIDDNDITDFSPLSRCQDLPREPRLTIRQPADLDRLATLTNLTYLELVVDSEIKAESWLDLTPLSRLTRLTRLNVRRIEDLTPLQTLTQLTHLELEGYELENLTPLQTLTKLTYLEIRSKCLADLSPLKFLTKLTELRISSWKTSITDLSPLAFLTKLTKLDLSSELVSDLSPLQGLTELTYIDCRSAKITDISPLATLTKLTWLNLVNNQISDISPLRSLINLRELYISGNPIADTSPLLNLPKLEYSSVRIQRLTVFAADHDPATPLTPPPELQQQYQAVLTHPIDRVEATAAVTAMYAAIGQATPEIYFFDSPLAGVERCGLEQKTQVPSETLGQPIVAQLVQSAMPAGSAAWKAMWEMMQFQPGEAIRASLGTQIWQESAESYLWFLNSEQMVACGSDFDAIKPRAYLTPEDLVEVIGVSQMYAQQEASPMQASHYAAQAAMRQLLATCGWIVPYENVCIVCDRPRQVRLNDENQLHATSEPAIEFVDGWHSGYYQQGQLLLPDVAAIVRGWHLLEQNDYNAVLTYCDDSIADYPKQSASFLTIRGVALMQLGSLESAMETFDRAIQLNQNDSLAWYNRACLCVMQGQFEQAIADLHHALELHPELAESAINDEDFDPIRDQIQFLDGQKSQI